MLVGTPAARLPIKRSLLSINLRNVYTAPCVMILMRGIHITRSIGRVVLKVEPVLGPGIARAYLGPLNGTKPKPKLIRNKLESVKCIKRRSGR